MKITMYLYNKLIQITGLSYNVIGHKDDDDLILTDDDALEDVITEYEALEEKYSDLKEKILNKISELEENKFMIDMIDHWSEADKNTYSRLNDEIKLLKEMLGD